MYTHVVVGANDIENTKTFYDAIFAELGLGPGIIGPNGDRCYYAAESGLFLFTKPINGEPASVANGGTISFAAKDEDEVNRWHAAGLKNGGTPCEDPPGLREGDGAQYYVAYLRDLAGNKICALHMVSAPN